MASIRFKINILVITFIIITTISISVFTYKSSVNIIANKEVGTTSLRLENEKAFIKNYFNETTNDLFFLSRTKFTKLFLSDNPNSLTREQLEHIFKKFLENHNEYFQIRLLDNKGMEVIRANKYENTVYLSAKKDLQDKSKRYYFTETIKKNPGELYFSPIDLNIEHGEIEMPHRPTVRIATPIYDDKDILGIVILNVDLNVLLKRIHQSLSSMGDLYLTNDKGDYLLHPNKTKSFRFNYGESHTLQKDYPALTDLFKYPETYKWSHQTKNIIEADNHVLYTITIPYNIFNVDDFITLSVRSSKDRITKDTQNIKYRITIIALAIITISIFISEIFTFLITSPIFKITEIAKNYMQDNHNDALLIDRDDELGELSRAIKHLIQRIHRSDKNLKLHRDNTLKTINEKTSNVKDALEETNRKLELKNILIGNIVDKFKVTTNNLLSTLEKLQDTNLGTPQSTHVEDLVTNTNKLSKYIDSIATLSDFSVEDITEDDSSRFLGKKALIAEDNRVNLLAITGILEDLKMTVITATDGYKALEEFKQNDIDVIFLDCKMPGIDGYEVTETIRKIENDEQLHKTPIIALTANDSEADEKKCLDCGMNVFISKPITKEQIVTILSDLIC